MTVVSPDGTIKKEEIEIKTRKGLGLDPRLLNIGMYLAVPLLIAVFTGNWLDSKFHTKPVITLVLIVLGMISSFYNLYKILKHAR